MMATALQKVEVLCPGPVSGVLIGQPLGEVGFTGALCAGHASTNCLPSLVLSLRPRMSIVGALSRGIPLMD